MRIYLKHHIINWSNQLVELDISQYKLCNIIISSYWSRPTFIPRQGWLRSIDKCPSKNMSPSVNLFQEYCLPAQWGWRDYWKTIVVLSKYKCRKRYKSRPSIKKKTPVSWQTYWHSFRILVRTKLANALVQTTKQNIG